jgi:hypothetical protein
LAFSGYKAREDERTPGAKKKKKLGKLSEGGQKLTKKK